MMKEKCYHGGKKTQLCNLEIKKKDFFFPNSILWNDSGSGIHNSIIFTIIKKKMAWKCLKWLEGSLPKEQVKLFSVLVTTRWNYEFNVTHSL